MAELEIFSMGHENDNDYDRDYERMDDTDLGGSIYGNFGTRNFQNFVNYSDTIEIDNEEQNSASAHYGNLRRASSVQSSASLSQNVDAVKNGVRNSDGDALSTLLMLSKSNGDLSKMCPEKSAEYVEIDHRRKVLVKEYFHKKNNQFEINSSNNSTENFMKYSREGSSPDKKRKQSRQNQIHFQPLSKTIKIDDLRQFFHLPINEVAQQLGTCATALKKICRRNKINKWPFRQIRSISKSIQSLEYATLNESLTDASKAQYKQQIITLRKAIDDIVRDPNVEVTLVTMGMNPEAISEQSDSNDDQIEAAAFNEGKNGVSSSYSHGDNEPGTEEGFPNMNPAESLDSVDSAGSGLPSGLGPNYSTNHSYTAPATTGMSHPGVGKKKHRSIAVKPKRQSSAGVPNRRPTKYNRAAGGKDRSLSFPSSLPFEEYSGSKGVSSGLDMLLTSQDISELERLVRPPVELFPVNVGHTKVNYDSFADSIKHQFVGPVQLAPLQRKKPYNERPDGKIVPLMEPDIGSNFKVDFSPRFILNVLDYNFRTTIQQSYSSENVAAETAGSATSLASSSNASSNSNNGSNGAGSGSGSGSENLRSLGNGNNHGGDSHSIYSYDELDLDIGEGDLQQQQQQQQPAHLHHAGHNIQSSEMAMLMLMSDPLPHGPVTSSNSNNSGSLPSLGGSRSVGSSGGDVTESTAEGMTGNSSSSGLALDADGRRHGFSYERRSDSNSQGMTSSSSLTAGTAAAATATAAAATASSSCIVNNSEEGGEEEAGEEEAEDEEDDGGISYGDFNMNQTHENFDILDYSYVGHVGH